MSPEHCLGDDGDKSHTSLLAEEIIYVEITRASKFNTLNTWRLLTRLNN